MNRANKTIEISLSDRNCTTQFFTSSLLINNQWLSFRQTTLRQIIPCRYFTEADTKFFTPFEGQEWVQRKECFAFDFYFCQLVMLWCIVSFAYSHMRGTNQQSKYVLYMHGRQSCTQSCKHSFIHFFNKNNKLPSFSVLYMFYNEKLDNSFTFMLVKLLVDAFSETFQRI